MGRKSDIENSEQTPSQPEKKFRFTFEFLLLALASPVIVSALIYFASIPSRVSAMEQKQIYFEKSVTDMETHLLIIRCRLKDVMACELQKHVEPK